MNSSRCSELLLPSLAIRHVSSDSSSKMDGLSLPVPLPSYVTDTTQQAAAPAPAPAPAGPPTCKNCGNTLQEILRCSQCKKATYCSPKCAKDDWPYHKRTCEKPKPKQEENKTPASSSNSPAPAPAPAAAPSSKPAGNSSSTDDVEYDEDEKKALAEVAKTGYRVHWRTKEDQAQWKEAVGEIKHEKVSSPTPVSAAPVAAAASTASAWNAAGTLEQRNMSSWFKDRLKQLLREGRNNGSLVIPLPGDQGGVLHASGIAGWGESSADILIKGGKVKYVYDTAFKLGFTYIKEGDGAGKEDVDMEEEGGAVKDSKEGGSSESAEEKEKDKEKAKDKTAKVWLRFPDVSSVSGDDLVPGKKGRDVVLEFNSEFPSSESVREAARQAMSLQDLSQGPTMRVRALVEQVVAEFKSK